MTPDELRAAIARDCPHRLVDYDQHVGLQMPTEAVTRLWRIEHAISSRPWIEQQLDALYRRAEASDDYDEIKACLAEASRIRHEAAEGLK
ncbi:hypothetical protein PL81_31125 [Streptomyces sp. RSD-27]|nr:hypothetical protein PL81_31125 [Streptomyces sp. RSD-27]